MDITLHSTVGIIGFGKMGGAFAKRFQRAHHHVIIFDPLPKAQDEAHRAGMTVAQQLQDLATATSVIFILIPAGEVVDSVLEDLKSMVRRDTIIIDAGNSHFHDSVRRFTMLRNNGIAFLDCGTSGGIHGLKDGFCLMVGGEKHIYEHVKDFFKDLAYPQGYAYVGPAGAGHFVKMVHNGIEYALLQSYADGFHLLKEGSYPDLDLAQIADLWNHGSIIRSFILELAAKAFDEIKDFGPISGKVVHSGMGQWAVNEAHKKNIPARLMEEALAIRKESLETGGDFATKVVAVLRNQFGGHLAKGCPICNA